MIPPGSVLQQYLWNIALQPSVSYNVWANLSCLGCSLLGEKSLWNGAINFEEGKVDWNKCIYFHEYWINSVHPGPVSIYMSILVQMIACCHQATSHYLIQCWHIKTIFQGIGIPIVNIRQLWDQLFFIMGIRMLARQHFFTLKQPCGQCKTDGNNHSDIHVWISIQSIGLKWLHVLVIFVQFPMSYLYFDCLVILQAEGKYRSEVIPLNPSTPPVSIICKANTYICQKLCQVVTHTSSWHLQWQNISPGIQGTMIYHFTFFIYICVCVCLKADH